MELHANQNIYLRSIEFQTTILNQLDDLTEKRVKASRKIDWLHFDESSSYKEVKNIDKQIQSILTDLAEQKIYPAFNWFGHRTDKWFFPTQQDVEIQKAFLESLEERY